MLAIDWSTYTLSEPLPVATFEAATKVVSAIGVGAETRVALELIGDARLHRQREAHVIDVLREAQANNGGYGFVRGLLEYLGAEEK